MQTALTSSPGELPNNAWRFGVVSKDPNHFKTTLDLVPVDFEIASGELKPFLKRSSTQGSSRGLLQV